MNFTHVQRVRILYKTIMRLHRGLPKEMQTLGTIYARDEFRRHMKCSPEQAGVFMNEWTDYAIVLAKQLGIQGPKSRFKAVGKPLTEEALEKFRPEQVQQLYELMLSATSPDSTIVENLENTPKGR